MRIIFFLLLFTGCSSTPYKSSFFHMRCEQTNWEQVYYDGLMYPAPTADTLEVNREHVANRQRMEMLEKACPQNGLPPDKEARAHAVQRLRKDLCTPSGAYKWGRAGNLQSSLCPASQELAERWRNGYRDHLVLQLHYLNNDGAYQEAVERHLAGRSLANTDPFSFALLQGEAKQDAARDLGIQPLMIKDDLQRQHYISKYSEALDKLSRSE